MYIDGKLTVRFNTLGSLLAANSILYLAAFYMHWTNQRDP